MLSEKMNTAINEQINAELFSSYLYLSMAAWSAKKGLKGFENWMKVQAQEELLHSMKFFDHVNGRGGSVKLEAIEQPHTEWENALDIAKVTLKHERKVTGLIHDLMHLAVEERDFASQNFLQWFISEQVEEEATADDIVTRLQLAADSKPALLMIDKELSARVFTMPVAVTP
jgi:ferritin